MEQDISYYFDNFDKAEVHVQKGSICHQLHVQRDMVEEHSSYYMILEKTASNSKSAALIT